MNAPATLGDALTVALQHASDYNQADALAPVVVLRTDAARQWETLLPRLRAELPILTLGPYDPSTRTGPALWLRCMIARALPEADWPESVTPILYLPGISRQELRAVDECPPDLQPLAELQYRGALWTHKNGRDWTIAGFMQAGDDLQIEVAGDTATREALLRSLPKLTDEPLTSLRAEAPLTAAKLNALLNPEPVRNLLLWMNAPAAQRAQQTDAEWAAFQATCRLQFGFDPVTDGEVSAALLLGRREGVWQAVWRRFAEAPQRYANLPDLLRRARPTTTDALFHEPSSWPQDNEAEEDALQAKLTAIRDALPADARKQIRELKKTHGPRRSWVWAELRRSPLAAVLPALMTLAEVTTAPLGGLTPQDIAQAYVSGGWKADIAVLDALAVSGNTDEVNAVKARVDALYRPWLQDSAEAFQQAVQSYPLPSPPPSGSAVAGKAGCCWLFADGLRYDIGQRLGDILEQGGYLVGRDWQWSALPDIVLTAKPAVSPVAPLLGPGVGFTCIVNADGGQRGLVCQYDVVCFDEVSGVSFDQKDGVNIMKGYMESGKFSRGRESIRADGGIVMVGNFDVDVEHQQRVSHLFGPMPLEMRDDTALMDRIHAYVPGWDVPKMQADLFTDHFGLVSDFLSECWTRLRNETRLQTLMGRVDFGGALSGRDTTAVNKTISGLLKLLAPSAEAHVSDDDLEWAVRLALECRRRVKEQQKRIGSAEFRNTQFSYRMGVDGVETFVSTPELQGAEGIGLDPLPPGHVWGIGPGGQNEGPGLYRIEVNATPGSNVKIANVGAPGALRESVQTAYQNLLARNRDLIGDRDAKQHELTVQVRAMDVAREGSQLGVPILLAFCSALLAKSLRGGLVVVGGMSIGGSFEPIHNAANIAELAVEKDAQTILFPVSARRQSNDLSDEMAARIIIVFYVDVRDALFKALTD